MTLSTCPHCGQATSVNMLAGMGYHATDIPTEIDHAKEEAKSAPKQTSSKSADASQGLLSQVFKSVEPYYYAFCVIAVIMLIIALCNIDHGYRPASAEDAIAGCWFLSLGFFGFFLGHCLLSKYNDLRPYEPAIPNGDSPGSLGTMNGIGTSLYGYFRPDGLSYVTYEFLCFFIPLIPVGCYRVEQGMTTQGYKKTSTSYRFYGSEKWRFTEVINIYLTAFGVIAMIIGGLCMIFTVFE